MASWRATEAKAQFSEVLDRAEAEGPQQVKRRKQVFYVLTLEQWEARGKTPQREKPFLSGWDALRPSSGETFDVKFPRLKSKPRQAEF